MLKNDRWIREQAAKGMIAPFEDGLVRGVKYPDSYERLYTRPTTGGDMKESGATYHYATRKVLSFGCSSYGYDIRLSPRDFKIFCHIPGTVVDPKKFNPDNLVEAPLHEDGNGQFFILPAHSYGLGVALERLEIPDNITCLFIGKSTYARCGLIANLTPGEAGWRGHLTLEFSNSSSADCRVYANEGVVQALFFEGDPCEVTYEARSGKYQDQPEGVVLARV